MLPLKLYNTLGRQLEEFIPLFDHQVGLYTCGPTVYNTAHLGNLRTYIFEDVLRRTLEFNKYHVKHVMNITDVGHLSGHNEHVDQGADKIEAAAKREHKQAYDISRQYERIFFEDLERLNVKPPTVKLRATETIDLQIELIQKLETKGVTYVTADGVYFDTSKFPHYGELSGQSTATKKAGARVAVNTEKKNPTDFALWKFSRPDEQRQMEWPSPWGVGFPGWHIECSAMAMKELGEQFDIHTGGIDHIPVHHENEIAQSETATGKHPFVKYWLHGEFLVLPDKRMGKSEGNALALVDVTMKGIHPLAFRYLSLQSHYRSPLSFTWESLEAASSGLQRLWNTIAALGPEKTSESVATDEWVENFHQAINDDLNTAKALAIVQQFLSAAIPAKQKVEILEQVDRVLALDLTPEAARDHVTPTDPRFESMLEDYETARAEKRFRDSDKIRQQFEELGVTVEDLPDGTSRLRKK